MKCQVLNSNGKRCNRKSVAIEQYHGDHEIYEYHWNEEEKDMTWVEIHVCEIHNQHPMKEDKKA